MRRSFLIDTRGSSAAEFSLVLPLLMLLLLGMIDTGRYVWEYNRAEKATQMGARFAVVTDPPDSAMFTTEYVVPGGLTQGDPIPVSALGTLTCTSTSCTCTTAPCPGLTFNSTAFSNIVARMQLMKPDIAASNVIVEYHGSGLGYAGDPNGMQLSPLVTVRLTGVTFTPLSTLTLAHLTLPDFATTLTAEDSSGTASN